MSRQLNAIRLRLAPENSLLRRIPAAWWAFALALIIYGLAAWPVLQRQSIAPHYVYLADALLHGRLDLLQPPVEYDLLVIDDKLFVAGSPMPAILLMPFVAVFGNGFSDILFGIVLGALNVALVQHLFRKWPITLLFAFGTPHLYLAALGSVWFNAHIVAILFGLLALREALGKKRWFVAGLWLAFAGLARPTVMFGAMFFVTMIWLSYKQRHRIRPLLTFATALMLGVAAHGLYNTARFGSPVNFGYQYVQGATNITSAYTRFGGFNPRFLPCNLFVSILSPPQVNGYVPPLTYDVCAYLLEGVNLSEPSVPITPNPLGMSVFIVTPAFLLMFAARQREATLAAAAWAGLLATMIPLWMYHNTGSVQFGYRYWMDAAPMWLLILSMALKNTSRGASRTFERTLIIFSIAINLWGFLWMFEQFFRVSWFDLIIRAS